MLRILHAQQRAGVCYDRSWFPSPRVWSFRRLLTGKRTDNKGEPLGVRVQQWPPTYITAPLLWKEDERGGTSL